MICVLPMFDAAVNQHARHALAPGGIQQALKSSQGIDGAGVVNPTVGAQGQDAMRVVKLQEFTRRWRQVGVRRIARAHRQISPG